MFTFTEADLDNDAEIFYVGGGGVDTLDMSSVRMNWAASGEYVTIDLRPATDANPKGGSAYGTSNIEDGRVLFYIQDVEHLMGGGVNAGYIIHGNDSANEITAFNYANIAYQYLRSEIHGHGGDDILTGQGKNDTL